jgi:predicted methyltransferase
MRIYKIFLLALFVLLSACATTPDATDKDLVTAAIANPERVDADRERDERSRPEVILGLLNIQQGDTVAVVFGGVGY